MLREGIDNKTEVKERLRLAIADKTTIADALQQAKKAAMLDTIKTLREENEQLKYNIKDEQWKISLKHNELERRYKRFVKKLRSNKESLLADIGKIKGHLVSYFILTNYYFLSPRPHK